MDTKGLDNMLTKLNGIEGEINKAIPEFVSKCAELATEEASRNFSEAIYAGTNDVVVNSPQVNGNSATISASGNAVTFIEFGTGIFYPNVHPDMALNGFSRGTYGKGKGSNPNGWVYRGELGNAPSSHEVGRWGNTVRTLGNPANMCMLRARETVSDRAQEIWKEVSGR